MTVTPVDGDVALGQTASACDQPDALRVQRIIGADAMLARIDQLTSALGPATPFQARPWLDVVCSELAPALGAEVLAIELRQRPDTAPLMLLPLAVRRERGLTVASFADLGVSDYNLPLLANGVALSYAEILSALRQALPGVDLLRFERMPRRSAAGVNPLATSPAARPSKFSANVLEIDGSVEDMLRSRGKKYRKEVERCYRLLEKEGAFTLSRAETAQQIERAYAVLSAQQSARHAGADHAYALDDPAFARFYASLLQSHAPSGFAHIFTLEVAGEIVAALFGVTHQRTFTLLRISNGGERWKHLSPGRLIVVEAMKYFHGRGVKRFDMGMGDYAFKRGFGIEPEPLVDLMVPLNWRAMPLVAGERAKTWVKARPWLMRLLGRSNG